MLVLVLVLSAIRMLMCELLPLPVPVPVWGLVSPLPRPLSDPRAPPSRASRGSGEWEGGHRCGRRGAVARAQSCGLFTAQKHTPTTTVKLSDQINTRVSCAFGSVLVPWLPCPALPCSHYVQAIMLNERPEHHFISSHGFEEAMEEAQLYRQVHSIHYLT